MYLCDGWTHNLEARRQTVQALMRGELEGLACDELTTEQVLYISNTGETQDYGDQGEVECSQHPNEQVRWVDERVWTETLWTEAADEFYACEDCDLIYLEEVDRDLHVDHNHDEEIPPTPHLRPRARKTLHGAWS